MDTGQFLTVEKLAEKYRAAGFTESAVRWMMFNRSKNGLDAAVVRIGRKVLIDEPAFIAWLRSQSERAAA